MMLQQLHVECNVRASYGNMEFETDFLVEFINQGNNMLSLAASTHVDNLNGAGEDSECEALIVHLEKEPRRK
eukprot:7050705-Heterocapsa_arctica.AAC.1